jgi:hypothetical protein
MLLGFNRVDRAVSNIIRDMKDGSGPFGLGQKGLDAKEVKDFTNALARMSPKEADAVFNKLEKMGKLDDFARALMDSPDLMRGMSISDRRNLFSTLARKLDGQSLAALTKEFANNAPSFGKGFDFVKEMFRAVSNNSNFGTKIDFMREMNRYFN